MRQFPLLLLIVMSLCWGTVRAQPVRSLDPQKALTQYHLDAWTADDGLPQNSVSTILQSRDGYLWLGTQEGLVRFDGTRFHVYDRRSGALRNNNVVALHEDRAGDLWIGTMGGGLVHHSKGRFTRYGKDDGLGSNGVSAIREDRAGTLWVGTLDAGLTRFSKGQVTRLTTADGLPANTTSALLEDRAGTLWVGTIGGGLAQYRDGRFKTFTRRDGLPADDVTSLFEDRAGNLWVGTRNGLARLRDGRFMVFDKTNGLPSSHVLAVYEDAAGTLWVGTDHGGLSRFRDGRFTSLTMDNGLAYDVVRTIYEDREGSLWIGTDGGGLNRLRNGSFTTHTTAEGLAHNFVYALYEDPAGALWVGTDGGVSRYQDGRFATYTTAHGLSSNYVLSVYGTRDGALWVGTYGAGLNRYQGGRFTAFTTKDGLPSDEIYALYEDKSGSLWVGTRYGLSRYADGAFKTFTTKDGLSSNDITSMVEDHEGRLWVGTYDGGVNLLKDGKVVRHYTKQDGLLSNFVLTLYTDAEGTVWIGTREGGLNRFRYNQFTSIAPEHGLFNENVFQILEDKRGNLWMSCNQGLFRVRKQDVDDFAAGRVDHVTSVVYDRHDGLVSTEFNGGFQPAGWAGRDGRLWFPSNKGLVAVDADAVPGGRTPKTLIERLVADEQVVFPGEATTLPAGTSKLQVAYVGVTFLSADKVSYRYQLEGIDKDWVYAGARREAFYTNLAPGHYTFKVMAAGSDGVWAEAPTVATFYLKPYFHQTPLFMLLCALAFGFIGFGAYRLRVRQLRTRHRDLLALVESHTRSLREEKEKTERALLETEQARREAERQTEIAQEARAVIEEQAAQVRELDRLKTRFFSNISHEFRTPLTLTIGPLENALTGVYGPVAGPLRKQLELILRNARRLLRLINQLLDLSKLDSGKMDLNVRHGNLVALLEGVVLSFTAFAEKKHLQLRFGPEHHEINLDFDPEGLEKVFFNLLSNAVKFTPDGGSIHVSVRETTATLDGETRSAVEIRVEDTGIGIPTEELAYIFDRFHQVDGAVSHAGEGTGIGLSLVRELVSLHGGVIEVESEPSVGTVFTVTLPRTHTHTPVSTERGPLLPDVSRGPLVEMAVFDDDDAEDGHHSYRLAPPGDGFGSLEGGDSAPPVLAGSGDGASRPTILVVDDNPDVREYISSSLDGLYRILTAIDGVDALARAREAQPDLIVSDVMMPNMDGYALCRALRADEALAAIPIILLTARAAQEDRLAGLEAGSTDYIAKPFNAPELHARIRNLLAMREQQQVLARLNDELKLKNTALQDATEMKSQLLHIAAHDMKNPLNAIREFARLIKNEVGRDSDIFDPLDLIHQSSDQMLHLVSSLLETEAIESGQIVLHTEPVNLNTLAASIIRRNRPLAAQKDQKLTLSIAEERCLVQADKDRLLEAMDNLVNNAIKYTPPHKSIWVTVERTDSMVRFSVKDEGPGLTPEDKAKLFGRFQRLSAQPTGGETSTGLGLAIVKQLTELHDGQVIVESERGEGSTFIMALPIITDIPAVPELL